MSQGTATVLALGGVAILIGVLLIFWELRESNRIASEREARIQQYHEQHKFQTQDQKIKAINDYYARQREGR